MNGIAAAPAGHLPRHPDPLRIAPHGTVCLPYSEIVELVGRAEQRRGACSRCVPVDPIREPEYWASRRRKFATR